MRVKLSSIYIKRHQAYQALARKDSGMCGSFDNQAYNDELLMSMEVGAPAISKQPPRLPNTFHNCIRERPLSRGVLVQVGVSGDCAMMTSLGRRVLVAEKTFCVRIPGEADALSFRQKSTSFWIGALVWSLIETKLPSMDDSTINHQDTCLPA